MWSAEEPREQACGPGGAREEGADSVDISLFGEVCCIGVLCVDSASVVWTNH